MRTLYALFVLVLYGWIYIKTFVRPESIIDIYPVVVYFSCPLAILVTWLATRDNSDRNHWPMRLWLVAIAYIAWNVVPAIIVVTRKSTVMFIDLWAYAGITLGLIILVIYFWLVLREVKVTARLPDAGAKQN